MHARHNTIYLVISYVSNPNNSYEYHLEPTLKCLNFLVGFYGSDHSHVSLELTLDPDGGENLNLE